MILAIEEQDSTFFLNSTITSFCKAHDMSRSHMQNFRLAKIFNVFNELVRYCSNAPWISVYETIKHEKYRQERKKILEKKRNTRYTQAQENR